jgi:hypothetical protein
MRLLFVSLGKIMSKVYWFLLLVTLLLISYLMWQAQSHEMSIQTEVVIESTATQTSSVPRSNIWDIFSYGTCSHACLLGVEPGQTTVAEIETILTSYGITWEREELGLTGQVVLYLVSTSAFSEPIAPNKEIVFWVGQSLDSIVGTIQIPIESTPLYNIISEYGSPSLVSQSDSLTALVYQEQGIVFLTSPEDYHVLTRVELRSPENITNFYLEMLPTIIPCSDPTLSCGIATATSSPR